MLAVVAEAYATVLVDNENNVTEWRPMLDKYTKNGLAYKACMTFLAKKSTGSSV